MGVIINLDEEKDKLVRKRMEELQKYKIWLPMPILIPDNFKEGDIIIRGHTLSNRYIYLIPDVNMINDINIKNKLNCLTKSVSWALTKNIETLIYNYENNNTTIS